jgi:alginate O-acetyltransferase complex protein AlgI
MRFNSPVFIFLFLPATILLYFGLNRLGWHKVSTAFLVAASWFFYAYWNPVYLPLLLTSIVVNLAAGAQLGGRLKAAESRTRKDLKPRSRLQRSTNSGSVRSYLC